MVEPERSPISWETFQHYLDQSIPGIHRIPGEPPADLFVDSGGHRIGIRIPVQESDTIEPTRLREVNTEIVSISGRRTLQVSTTSSGLFRDFMVFAQTVADLVQLEGTSPVGAVFKTLERWRELLSSRSVLSEEVQVGLWGELVLLDRLVSNQGSSAIASWTGPIGEVHDFRIGTKEFEVKTTRGQRRIHVINSLEQLIPSVDHTLYRISIQIALGGKLSGISLSDLVNRIRSKLLNGSTPRSVFEDQLAKTGFQDRDSFAYETHYQLRGPLSLIQVDDRFPRISRTQLDSFLGANSHRIDDVRYRLNVDGLGITSGLSEIVGTFSTEGKND